MSEHAAPSGFFQRPGQDAGQDAGLDGLTTARLKLRRFTLDDEALLHRLNSSAAVMRHLGGPMDAASNRAMLEGRILRYYDEHPGLGVWATLRRENDHCVGFHLLNHVMGETLIQIGYRLFEADWGRGYATEMSVALLRYGYTTRRLETISANADLTNLDSQRVLLKCGLHRKGERAFAHPLYAPFGPMAYFERDAASWLSEFGG